MGSSRTFPVGRNAYLLFVILVALNEYPLSVNAFNQGVQRKSNISPRVSSMTQLFAGGKDDTDIQQQLAKAKALLEKTKAKLEKEEQPANGDSSSPSQSSSSSGDSQKEALPFFAVVGRSPEKMKEVIKSRNEETGLVTADGEKMAELSESEQWEARPLGEVFENELNENEDLYSMANEQLAERDVAASIWNLRKTLQGNDYRAIFDKKNRFIGEDN